MSNISVAITADVADLNAKLAIAQSNVRAFSAETRQAADAMRAAGASATGEMRAALEAAADSLAKAKASAAALNAELKATSGASASFRQVTSSLQSLGSGFSSATGAVKGFIAAFAVREIIKFAEDANKAGLEMELLAQKSRIGVAALSDLKYAADQQNVSLETLGAALRGLGVTVEQAIINPASKQAAAYRQLGIDTDFLRAHQNDLQAVLLRVANAYATGGTATQQMENAQLIFLRGGREIIPVLQLGTSGLERMAQRARELGGEMSPELAEKLAENARRTKDVSTAWEGAWEELAAGSSMIEEVKSDLIKLGETAQDVARWFNRMDAAATSAIKSAADWAKGLAGGGTSAGESIIGKIIPLPPRGVGGTPPAPGEKPAVPGSKPWADLPDPSQQVTALEKFRTDLAEMEASWTGTHQAMLAEAVKMWEAELASGKLNAKEQIEARRELANATRQLTAETTREKQTIERQDTDADIAISKLSIEAKKQQLTEELGAHRVTADQKLEILRDLTNQEYALDLKRLQDELSTLQQDPVAYDRVYNQIRVLKAKLNEDLAALDRTAAEEARKAAEEQARAWKGAISEITSSETTFLGDYLTGRKTAAQSVASLVDNLALREIEADARAFTTKALYSALGLQLDAKEEQGGILWHLIGEQQKNAATSAGVATRTTINATENTSLIGQIGQTVARWLGMETAKTTATSTQAASRTAVQTAAETAGMAESVAAGFSQISIDAAVAAAGAFAATAQIPYVGPVLAPEAAAAAYAEVMGWAAGMGGVGLATGAWNIPTTMQATLHQGEIVMPKPFADEYRANARGGSSGNNFTMGDVHVHGANLTSDDVADMVVDRIRNFHAGLMSVG